MTTDGSNAAPSLQTAPEALPQDLSACHTLIQQLVAHGQQLAAQRQEMLEQLSEATRKLAQMEHQFQLLLRRFYGRSAEKMNPQQMALFEQLLEQLAPTPPPTPPAEPAPKTPSATPTPNGAPHGRRKIPADLPRERVIHDLPEEEKPCPCCGQMRCVIAKEVHEKLDYVPAKIKVIEHVRLTYTCRACELSAAESGSQIVTADQPLSPIEKGLAAPGLLAYVIVSKYSDHLPLHRLERILERHGIDIARSTMCDWMRDCAELLKPLYNIMVQEVRASKVIHTDDTTVKVLDKNLPQTRTGRFWIYLGDDDHPYSVFTHTATRQRDGPMKFLNGWGQDRQVYLQADAFGGYDGIYSRRSRRESARGGVPGPCPTQVLRRPKFRCRHQHAGAGLHPTTLRCGRSGQGPGRHGIRPQGAAAEVGDRAPAPAAGTLRAPPAAIQSVAGIPAGGTWWAGVAQESHGRRHHLPVESVGRLVRLHHRWGLGDRQ